MTIYNITIKIFPAIETEWLQWQQQEHIPEVMASDQFAEYKFYRLLEQNEPDSITYVVQYFASSFDRYNTYIAEFVPAIRQKALERWDNKFIAFRTIMQVVN